MKAVICPVCIGNGLVPDGFYTQTSGIWTSTNVAEKCRSCDGRGYLWVPIDYEKNIIEANEYKLEAM